MFKIEKKQFFFFLLWFLIVSVCIYLGALLSYPLGEYLYTHNGMSYSASNDGFFEGVLSLLLLTGLFMGFGEWVVINTKIKKAHNWILATLIGFALGSFISFLIFSLISVIVGKWIQMIGSLAGAGLFTGICQWVSLKRKITTSLRWSLVMASSFAIGMGLNSLIDYSSRATSFIIFSITVGLISGIFVESLIFQPEIQLQ